MTKINYRDLDRYVHFHCYLYIYKYCLEMKVCHYDVKEMRHFFFDAPFVICPCPD